MNKRLSLYLRVAVSLGLMVFLLVWLVDFRAAGRALAGARWEFLLLHAVVIVLDRILMSEKWRLLVVSRGMELGWWEALRSYFVASFAGFFLPSTVGADALRVGAVAGPGRPSEVVASSVMVERAMGFVAGAMAAMLGALLLGGLVVSLRTEILWWTLGLFIAAVAAVAFSFYGPLGRWLGSLGPKLEGRGKVLSWLGRLASSYSLYRDRRGVLAVFLLLSFLEQAAPAIGTWLVALALGVNLSLLQALAVTPVALIFIRIPVSLSGFGVVEGLYVAFFGLVGVSSTESFLLGLITTLVVIITTLPGAWFYAFGGIRARRRAAARGDQT